MSIEITDASITFPEDTTITDMVIKYSTIWLDNEATLTLGPNSSVHHCSIYAPRETSKVAIDVVGPDATCSHNMRHR